MPHGTSSWERNHSGTVQEAGNVKVMANCCDNQQVTLPDVFRRARNACQNERAGGDETAVLGTENDELHVTEIHVPS